MDVVVELRRAKRAESRPRFAAVRAAPSFGSTTTFVVRGTPIGQRSGMLVSSSWNDWPPSVERWMPGLVPTKIRSASVGSNASDQMSEAIVVPIGAHSPPLSVERKTPTLSCEARI
jgi:hypothetical protein